MLQIENLWVSYGQVEVLKGLSFEVPEGEIITLLGGNGSGKSTTLKAIIGAVRAQGGSIRFQGREILRLKPEAIVPLGISMIPQGRRIFAPLTVRENLRLGAFTRRDSNEIREDLSSVLRQFPEVEEKLKARGGTLSVGQQQMVAFGRGLMARPRLLLMDEPSAGLAPKLVERLAEIIREIHRRGMTILLVEQNVHLALSLAKFAYVLRDGKIAMAQPAEQLVGNEELIRQYLGG
jgi:branched-chain amino acid transport system ATP-binding protein